MTRKHLLKSTGIIGSATSVSRVLGFVRDVIIADLFGTAMYAQAFVVAFRIPNLLRDLVGEGAMNAAFVPVLTGELAKKGREAFFKLSQVLLNIIIVVLAVITVIGVAAAPIIIRIIAPGFSADPEKFRVTVELTRVIFPFLVLVGLWAYAMGVLNSLHRFAAPAFGPCVLNLSIIACASYFGENVFGLASGVIAGGILQLAIQVPSLYRNGWKARLTNEFSHPMAKKIGMLLVPRALGACVYQVNVFIGTILASLSSIVGEGAVAALYYANRLWQLPLAVFGIALAQAALPTMSRQAALEEPERLKNTIAFSLTTVFFFLLPATVGLMILSMPITRVLFQRGAFTSYSTYITSQALFYYALGLVSCGGIKVLVSAFYSMQDTVTPVKIAAYSLAINIIANLALMWPMKTGGLALAASISVTFNFIALYIVLRKRLKDFGTRKITDSFFRVLLSSAVMGFFLKVSPGRFNNAAIDLAVTIIMGITVFITASYVFGVEHTRKAAEWITRKK